MLLEATGKLARRQMMKREDVGALQLSLRELHGWSAVTLCQYFVSLNRVPMFAVPLVDHQLALLEWVKP